MYYRRLGSAGIKVSEISLGTWILCDALEKKETAFEVIDKAYELGINFFDTANAYSDGRAEMIVGEALRKYPRSSYVLATKVYWPKGPGPNERGLSRKHIFDQVHASLERLGTSYIDLYYCHWFDPDTRQEETLRAMDDLVRQGKVLYVGVSNWSALQISQALGVADRYLLDRIVASQPSYNMFDRYIEEESIALCEANGIGQVVYSPLAQGVLTGKYRKGAQPPESSRVNKKGTGAMVTVFDYLQDEFLEKAALLEEIAHDIGLELSQLALAWVLRVSNVASAVIGASRPDQVEANATASGVRLPEDVQEAIRKVLDSMRASVRRGL